MELETKEPATESEYEKRERIAKEEIKKLSEKHDSPVLDSLARQDNDELKERCDIIRRIFNESLEMYESGSLDFEEFVSDLSETLEAYEEHEEEETEEEEKEDHGEGWEDEEKEEKKEKKEIKKEDKEEKEPKEEKEEKKEEKKIPVYHKGMRNNY